MEIMYTDEDITISLEYYENLNMHFIHSNVTNWSLSKYKKFLLIFGTILNSFRERDIKTVFALPPSEKEEKWERLFGFSDTGQIINNKYKLMRLNVWE